jgi:putative SOS response-associated peptidase YedK
VKFIQSESFKPVFSACGFNFPALPVISNQNPESIDLFNWGLIPFWVKDSLNANSIRQRTLNARSETIFEKPAFKQSIISKRCLVLADGFFEWRHIGNKTFPYLIQLKSREPFAFAGVWDNWVNPDTKERVRSFSIITTRANSLLAKIHNIQKRMPVILPKDKEKEWLNNSLAKETVQSLMQPYEAEQMEGYPVARIVHDLGFNTTNPEVLERQEYPELINLTRNDF